jgi:hypothetical protein
MPHLLMPLSTYWQRNSAYIPICCLARRRCCSPADAAEPLLAARSQLLPLSAQRQQLRVQAGQLQEEVKQQAQAALAEWGKSKGKNSPLIAVCAKKRMFVSM